MNKQPYVTLITCYHFGRTSVEEYDRLLRSLRSSIREVRSSGRMILVANGTSHGAAPPESVIGDLPHECQKFVYPVTLQSNARNVGGLNAGIAYALKFSSGQEDAWIGQIQSSVVLQPGWLEELFPVDSASDALFGRLVYEDDPSVIWADGHYLKCGCTWNLSFNESTSSRPPECKSVYPCLSASVFREEAVESVVRKYGSFVLEALKHYGDCTDVALRLRDCGRKIFEHRPNAIALKRRPKRDFTQEAVAQLVAARLYYKGRLKEAETRLMEKNQYRLGFIDAQRQAEAIVSTSYRVTGGPPPSGVGIDCKWNDTREACDHD